MNNHINQITKIGIQCASFVETLLRMADRIKVEDVCETLANSEKRICCFPARQVQNSKKKTKTATKINERVFLMETEDGDKYIYKNDEQAFANELSFVTNVFMCQFSIPTPKIALVHFDFGEIIVAQAIEYWSDLKDFDVEEALLLPTFPEQLAHLVAFCFFVGDFDNFNFLGKFVDNFYFPAIDEDFEPFTFEDEDLFDPRNVQLNPGNITIHKGYLALLDIRATTDDAYREACHNVATQRAEEIAILASRFFIKNPEKRKDFRFRFTSVFLEQFANMIIENDKLKTLIAWATAASSSSQQI